MNFRFDRPLASRILRLAYPIAIAMLAQTAVNQVDTILVGRLPAEESIPGQTAIGFSIILLWAFGGLIASLSVGTQALVARRVGEGNLERAGPVLDTALWVGGLVSAVASVGIIAALPAIFRMAYTDPKVVELGVAFSTYRIIGMSSMVMTIILKGFFDGIGRTKVHMTAAIVMNIANIVLNWLLIFGVGPFPEMGVGGSGLASLIATWIGLGIMFFAAADGETRRSYRVFQWGSFDGQIAKTVARVGLPGGIGTFVVMSGFAMFLVIVGWIDTDTRQAAVRGLPDYASFGPGTFGRAPASVWTSGLHAEVFDKHPPYCSAATKVIIDLMAIVFMTCMAFGQASATLVGQALGAKDPDRAERSGWEAVKVGAAILGVIGLVIAAFPEACIHLFNPDPGVIAAGKNALRVIALASPFIAVGMILAQSLLGAGNSMYVMVVEFALHFFVLIPFSYVFGVTLDGGIVGIWCAAVLYLGLLAVAMAWRFRHGGWKHIVL